MAAKKKKDDGETNGAQKASPYKGAVEQKREVMRLPVKATREALEKASHEWASLHFKREALKARRRNAMAGFKDEFSSIDQRMGELATTVENDTVLSEVTVVTRLLPTGETQRVRLDTHEVLKVDPPAEQVHLDQALTRTDALDEEEDEEDEEEQEMLKGPQPKSART